MSVHVVRRDGGLTLSNPVQVTFIPTKVKNTQMSLRTVSGAGPHLLCYVCLWVSTCSEPNKRKKTLTHIRDPLSLLFPTYRGKSKTREKDSKAERDKTVASSKFVTKRPH